MWMYITMLLYAKERDTNGRVPASFVSASCHGRAPLKLASRLVDVGLLYATDDGWEIEKYAEKQGADASLSEKRAKDAERKRRQREAMSRVTPDDGHAPRAEQSRAEECSNEHSAHEDGPTQVPDAQIPKGVNLGAKLGDLQRSWPSTRCRPADVATRENAFFDVVANGADPDALIANARRYIAAHEFTNATIDGCPSLHRWLAEKRWLEPLPKPSATASAQGRVTPEERLTGWLKARGIDPTPEVIAEYLHKWGADAA